MPALRPLVTLKLAQTLDGRIATATGMSRWVSGPESRALAHRLRAEHDAVLVGIGTVLADDPRLDVRLADGRNPLRVVADSKLRVRLDAAIFRAGTDDAIVAAAATADPTKVEALRTAGIRIVEVKSSADGLDLDDLLSRLGDMGVSSVLVEGGAGIATSLLRTHSVDRFVIVVAPKILGAGIDSVGDLGALTMDQAIGIGELTIERSGSDVVFGGFPVWPSE